MDDSQVKINNYIAYKIDNLLMPLVSILQQRHTQMQQQECFVSDTDDDAEEYVIPRTEFDSILEKLNDATDRMKEELQSLRVLVSDFHVMV